MARCARPACARWRPDTLVNRGGMGIRLDEQWYCSTPCLDLTVQERLSLIAQSEPAPARRVPPAKLGVLLRAANSGLTTVTIDRALQAQKESGRRLGDELRHMGAVIGDEVLRALALQANTRYLTTIDPAHVRPGYGHLSRDMVRALGLVPFAANGQLHILKVAYVAPVPRLALAALHELTGWTPEPYLVDDELWPGLLGAYGTSASSPRMEPPASWSLRDASARIVHAIEQGRDAHIAHARIDPYVWVRVQTSDLVEDVLMSAPAIEDTSCLMAHMSH